MGFTPIDYTSWDRRDIHEYFKGTSIYLTAHLDITAFLVLVKKLGIRFYPAVIHCVASVVNRFPEYRYGYGRDKSLGIWDEIHPLYTVPRQNNPQLFSMAVTRYQSDFTGFYQDFLRDSAMAEGCGRLFSDDDLPPNIMGVTAMPGLHFSSFAFGDPASKPDFTPFVVVGKYEERYGKTLLPLFGEFVHSVNDGFHISRFFQEAQRELDSFRG